MANNDAKLLGLHDELSSFLTQINLYGSKEISDSHDTATFLMLYNGHPWTRRTGKAYCWLLSMKPLVFVSLTMGQMKVVVLVAPSLESSPSLFFLVTGHANFQMERTALTVGGFTQPGVARNIIEQHTGAERGFSQRFLWIFPRPTFAKFASLQQVSDEVTESIGLLK